MLRDSLTVICIGIIWYVTVSIAYETGLDDGYWEHEAEENEYVCELWT